MLAQAEENPYAALPLLKMVLTRMYVPRSPSLRQRRKLEEYNTLEDVLELLQKSKRIIVLCGAGISVSCGIPDFRSKDGIYSILANENQYQLDDPSDMYVSALTQVRQGSVSARPFHVFLFCVRRHPH